MPPKKDKTIDKKINGIKRPRPETSTLEGFFNTKQENKKIRTNSKEIRETENIPENLKEPKTDQKKNAQDLMNLFNCNKKTIQSPNILSNKKDVIPPKYVENYNIFNFQKVVTRFRGNQLIDNSSELKFLNEIQSEKLISKYRSLSSHWIKTQLGLCLRGVQCNKNGKLFSSKFKPCRTNELLEMKTSDRIVSWLCGFVEKKKSKPCNNSASSFSKYSDDCDFTPKQNPSMPNKSGLLNFFGANIKDNKPNSDHVNEAKNAFKKKSPEESNKTDNSLDTPKPQLKRLRKNKQVSAEKTSENKQSAGLENLLFWESKQYYFNGQIFCGTAGQGKKTTISAICQSAKIEVENIDCGLYEKFSEIKDKFNNGIRHQDVKVNLNENKNLNCLNANNELENSNVAENSHLNDKLKDLKLKKVFIFNNFETLFKDAEVASWGKQIKSIMDFFEMSSYPFVIATNPKYAQILGDYLYDFDIIVGGEKDEEKIYALFYQILFCEKLVENLDQDLKRDQDKQELEKNKDHEVFLTEQIHKKFAGIDIEKEVEKINIDVDQIRKVVLYFEGNLNALFSRIEQYKKAFYYESVAKKNLYDDLLLWRINRMDLDEELVKNVLYYKSYQYSTKNNRKQVNLEGLNYSKNDTQNLMEIDLDIIKIDNLCEYIKISDEYKTVLPSNKNYQINENNCLKSKIDIEKNENSEITSSSCKNGITNEIKDLESSNSVQITEKKSKPKNSIKKNFSEEPIIPETNINESNDHEILALQKQLLMLDTLAESEFMQANMEHLKEEVLQNTLKFINPNKCHVIEDYLLKRDWVYHNDFKPTLVDMVKFERPHDKFKIEELEFYTNCLDVDYVEKSRYVGYRRLQRNPKSKKIIDDLFEEKETIEMFKQIKKLKENMKTTNRELETYDPSDEYPDQFAPIVIEKSISSNSEQEVSVEEDLEKDFWKV